MERALNDDNFGQPIDDFLQIQTFDNCAEVSEGLKSVATTSQSNIVYAYDEEGNEMALGLILDSPFNPDPNTNLANCQEELRMQGIATEGNINWLGAQEECVVSQSENIDVVKMEESSNVEIAVSNDRLKKNSSVMKIYKSRKYSKEDSQANEVPDSGWENEEKRHQSQ